MNKSLITSVSPKECELIARGRQTVLVRKTRPKIETPFKSYIYKTKYEKRLLSGVGILKLKVGGAVIGEFVCDMVEEYTFSGYNARYRINDVDLAKTSLNHPELIAYGKGKILYGWHISDLKIYDKPKELGEFGNYKTEWVQWYHSDDKVFYPLKRMSGSWCYIDEE